MKIFGIGSKPVSHMRDLPVVIVAIIFFSLSVLVFAPTVSAQTPSPGIQVSIQIDAHPAFEGNFKYGEWLPVLIELTNNGPDISAEVRIPVPGGGGTMVFAAPVELPAGAHKEINVYVLPNNFTRQLDVELVKDEKLLASQRISVSPNPNVNYLVGIIAPERGALTLINTIELPGMKRVKTLIDIPLDELPEKFEGLRSFDLLVLNDTDTSKLTPLQVQALESWVRDGGRFVIGGGARAEVTVLGLPESLFPAEITGTPETSDLSPLELFAGGNRPIIVPGRFIVADLETDSGRTLAGTKDNAFIHEWVYGKGFVTFISLDPAVSPFDAWNGATVLWEKLLSPGAAYPEYLPTDISSRQQFASNMPYALSNLPLLDLPSARGLAVMLGLYIILVGPINYIVLQRLKRLHWAWISIPAITIFFSAASFGLGYALHGTDIFVNKITIIQATPDGNAHFDSFIGVFSPAQTAYEVEVKQGGLLSPMTPYYEPWSSFSPPASMGTGRSMSLIQGDPAIVQGLSVDQWSMQSFMSEGTIADFGHLAANLELEGERLEGNLTNTTRYVFEDAFVISGNKFAQLGEIQPGAQVSFGLDLSDLGAPNFGSPLSYAMFEKEINDSSSTGDRRKAEVRRSIVENLLERTPPYISASKMKTQSSSSNQTPIFIGWISQAPPEVRVVGSEPVQQTTAAVIVPLNYELPKSGLVAIPVGMVPGIISAFPSEGGSCGMPGALAIYITRGEAVFDFTMPAEAAGLELENLKLALYSDGGVFDSPIVELFNWQTEKWITLSGVNQGVNLVPQADIFASSDGMIRVRLSVEGGQYCYYVALGLEGSR